jgi:threonine dehydrogenase-like Zn-dependent dehydrogenase
LGLAADRSRLQIELLASGDVRVDPLVSGIFSLEEHPQAFDEARRGLKSLFAVA